MLYFFQLRLLDVTILRVKLNATRLVQWDLMESKKAFSKQALRFQKLSVGLWFFVSVFFFLSSVNFLGNFVLLSVILFIGDKTTICIDFSLLSLFQIHSIPLPKSYTKFLIYVGLLLVMLLHTSTHFSPCMLQLTTACFLFRLCLN